MSQTVYADLPPDAKPSSELVLILHSYHEGFVWTDRQNAGIHKIFREFRPQTELTTEYLDWKRFRDSRSEELLRALLVAKYSVRRPALIMTTDDKALLFALELRQTLCPSIPIVFCGINKRMDKLPEGVTGVYEDLDPEGTLSLAFALQPDTKQVFVIQDDTLPNGPLFGEISVAAKRISPEVRVERSGGISSALLAEKVSSLGHGDIILQANYNLANDGSIFSHGDALSIVRRHAKVPVYGLWSFIFGDGIVGGSLLDGMQHGADAASIALRILSGVPPSQIPLAGRCNTLKLVDFRQLSHFGMSLDRVPPEFKIEFIPPSFYESHRTLILAGGVVLLAQSLTILLLAVSFIRRRHVEDELSKRNSFVNAMLKNMPFDFWACDIEQRIRLQSDEGVRRWGDLSGRFFDGGNAIDMHRDNHQAFAGKLVDRDIEETHPEGLRLFRRLVAPVQCDGVVIGALGMNVDVTFRRRAEVAFRQSEERLRAILNSIADGVVAVDPFCKIIGMNPAAESITGFKVSDALGHSVFDIMRLLDVESGQPLDNPAVEVLRSGKATTPSAHVALIDKGGAQRHLSLCGTPILSESAALDGAVVVFRDITGEYFMQEHLRQAKKLETVGQLAGGVAHDFNNMLSAILGSAEMLALKCGDDPKLRSYAENILDAGSRATDLIRKLLDFSRKGKLDSIPVDIHITISSAIALLERSIDRKIALETNFMAEDFIVIGDPTQLQNSILNLALNARDAMPEGGVITIATRNLIIDEEFCKADPLREISPGECIEIDVFDTGVGMDVATLDRIFEPFFTTKKGGQGSGLGLSAVYGCIKDHKGSIRVASELNKGSTFKIFLPVSTVSGKMAGYVAERPVGTASGLILVIDDEPAIQCSLHAMLSELGYQVLISKDAMDGIEIFKANTSINLVILDMVMPKMNGSDVFAALRSLNPDVRVLITSGYVKNEAVVSLIGRGAKGFLQKPANMRDLSAAVSLAIS